MVLQLDGVKERAVTGQLCTIECTNAVWTYKYTNGYVVTLRGPLTATMAVVPNPLPPQTSTHPNAPPPQTSYMLKIEHLQFDANTHDKLIVADAIMGMRREESPSANTPRMNSRLPPGQNGTMKMEDEDKKQEEGRLYIDQASIPAEPVNAFGIPQATMRCLEVSLFCCALFFFEERTWVIKKVFVDPMSVGGKCCTDV